MLHDESADAYDELAAAIERYSASEHPGTVCTAWQLSFIASSFDEARTSFTHVLAAQGQPDWQSVGLTRVAETFWLQGATTLDE